MKLSLRSKISSFPTDVKQAHTMRAPSGPKPHPRRFTSVSATLPKPGINGAGPLNLARAELRPAPSASWKASDAAAAAALLFRRPCVFVVVSLPSGVKPSGQSSGLGGTSRLFRARLVRKATSGIPKSLFPYATVF